MNIWRLLFDPRGQISRARFAVTAFALVAIKIAGDFAIAQLIFHRACSLRNYFFSHLTFLFDNSTDVWKFDAVLLVWAAPFAWMGLSLLAKRLRSARAPIPLVILFFVPIAKFFLFVVLCVLPERRDVGGKPQLPPRIRKWAPESPLASAILAVLCSTLVGVAFAVLATHKLRDYSAWLFLGLPFLMGFLAAWLHGLARPRKLRESFAAAYLTLAITGAILLSIAVEGIICLQMAAPIALCEATIGAWIAHSIHRTSSPNGDAIAPAAVVCLSLPLLMLVESVSGISPNQFAVKTELSIDAPAEIVWRHVISFHEIPPPHEWVFRLGVAYPQRAEIDGHGVGALRHCVFSTGEFTEPITVWDEPNQLGFDVISQPDPLKELSPYRNLRPSHLDGYFQSHRGEFRLIRINNRTVLVGTTWYSNRMEPQVYWKIWSDALIHRIHMRVLEQIKREAEAEAAPLFDSAGQSIDHLTHPNEVSDLQEH
jgi:uncharacterized membrane protein YhaH (DUF805 family)